MPHSWCWQSHSFASGHLPQLCLLAPDLPTVGWPQTLPCCKAFFHFFSLVFIPTPLGNYFPVIPGVLGLLFLSCPAYMLPPAVMSSQVFCPLPLLTHNMFCVIDLSEAFLGVILSEDAQVALPFPFPHFLTSNHCFSANRLPILWESGGSPLAPRCW